MLTVAHISSHNFLDPVSSCLDPSFLDHSLPFAPNIINSPFPAPANFLDPLPSTPYSIDSIVPSQKMTFTAINAVSSATQVERTTKRASKPGAKDALNDAVREKPAVSAEQVKKPSKRSQFTKDWKCSRCQYKAEMRGDVHAHISRSLTHDPAVDYADRIGKGKENMALHKMPVNQFKTYMNRPQGRAPRKGKATINQTDGSTSTASTGNNNSSSANTINNPETAASSSSIPTAGKKRKRIETPNPTEESPGTTESASVNASSTDPEKELRKRIYIDPKTGSKNLVNRIVNHTPEPVNSAATGASPTSTHADKENHRPTKVKRINLIVKAEPASPSSQQ
ncbi:hypothetical protein DFH27DRAFT_385978 [Peziza echinospora]|nr:hypothetical protein DFH27DRAFT_385978 [Peziza echinospora]